MSKTQRHKREYKRIKFRPSTKLKKITTDRSFTKRADINHITRGYLRHGVRNPDFVPGSVIKRGVFSPTSNVERTPISFVESCHVTCAFNNAFERLPEKTRAFFQYQPKRALAFISDPANRKVSIALGLILPTPAEREAAVPPNDRNKPDEVKDEGKPDPKGQADPDVT